MNYWLMKSEPDAFSIWDLKKMKRSPWDGVRNYQARNIMRDKMKLGDPVLFYHSNAKPPGVIGTAKVVKESYPDHTAWDPDTKYYDPKSTEENPRWFMVDIEYVSEFSELVPLDVLRETKGLEEMVVTQRSRLSVQPVRKKEFDIVCKMGK